MTVISNSIGLKRFLRSYYKDDFYIEKSNRKEGEKIFVFTKEDGLPKKFVSDLFKYNSKVKVNGNRTGLSLKEWKEFAKSLGGKESEVKKKEDKTNGTDPIVNKKEIVEPVITKDKKDYWNLSKEEFMINLPESAEVEDAITGELQTYTLNPKIKIYFNRENEEFPALTPEAVHEKLICNAYKEGKEIDLNKVVSDYPFFQRRCNGDEEESSISDKNKAKSESVKELWELSKEEFFANLPEEVTVEDFNTGDPTSYVLERNKGSYFHFQGDHPVSVAAPELIHERLICKALREGKNIDKEKVLSDYPYFFRKCKNSESEQIHTEVNAEQTGGNEELSQDEKFVNALLLHFEKNERLNKRDLEKIGTASGIKDINRIFELAEFAWIKWYRHIALSEPDIKNAYEKIVDFYKNVQPTFSLRDSVRVEFQQYSTPGPISYLAQEFCRVNKADLIFEPSAGNGLLVFAAPFERTIANELDKQRLENLKRLPFREVLNQDAELPFTELQRKADAVLSNPPFGRLSDKIRVDGYKIKALDHAMITIALDTMKDDGRAALIIGGHTTFDENGMIRAFRIFFNWLFHFYNVCDIINIDGDLYSKQGTNFDIRLILIDGRKEHPQGFAPMIKDENHPIRTTVKSFEDLFERIDNSIQNPEWIFPKAKEIKVQEILNPNLQVFDIPLYKITLYEYGIRNPLNTYEVKKVSEINLEEEDWYRLAHKAIYKGEKYYVMAWKKHYEEVSEALKKGIHVPFEIARDYPDLLRLYSNNYENSREDTLPTFKEWLKQLAVSRGIKEVVIFSSLNSKVFFKTDRSEWERKYNDEYNRDKLFERLYRQYIKNSSEVNVTPEFPGNLILLISQLNLAHEEYGK